MEASSVATTGSALHNGLFKELAERSPRPILITDAAADIRYVNRAWEQQFGYSLAEVYGKNPRILKSGKTPPRIFKRMWAALDAGKTFRTDQFIDRRKNGRLCNLFSTISPIHAGGSTYYVQILDDITKRKKLQAYQNTFIKIAAHDIRSPLAGIQLMSELLEMKVRQHVKDDLTVDIHSLHDEVVRVSRLVSTLLDISLFESGKVKLKRGQVRLCKLIGEVIEHIHRLAPLQRFTVRCADTLCVAADRERIRQVLINLLENAIKYTTRRRLIIISVVQKPDSLVVSVLDRGPGISKKAASLIFQPFYRAESAKKSNIKGHGLGLHIVHKIIQAHHGHIWVEPRTGGGSIFSFTLPCKSLNERR